MRLRSLDELIRMAASTIASGPAPGWTRWKNSRVRAVPSKATPGPTSMVTRLETRCGAEAAKCAAMRSSNDMPSRRASDGSRVKSAPCARLWPASTMEDGSVMREPFMVGRTAKRVRRTPEAAKLAIREALIDSVRRFSAKRLLTDIDAILEAWDVDQLDMRRLGGLFRRTYADHGAARLIFWLALSGRKPRGSGLMGGLIAAVHQARERRALACARTPPPISDTRFVIALLSSVHAVMPVAGDALLRSAAAEAGEAGAERFLDWVASLLDAHLNAAGS